VVNCDEQSPKKKEVCDFEISSLGDVCTLENSFGYKNGTPCVLLKVNKVSYPPDWHRTITVREGKSNLLSVAPSLLTCLVLSET